MVWDSGTAMSKLMISARLILAVDDQPRLNNVPTAVKLTKQEGVVFVHWRGRHKNKKKPTHTVIYSSSDTSHIYHVFVQYVPINNYTNRQNKQRKEVRLNQMRMRNPTWHLNNV